MAIGLYGKSNEKKFYTPTRWFCHRGAFILGSLAVPVVVFPHSFDPLESMRYGLALGVVILRIDPFS